MSTNGANPRRYETGRQLTVADLLRREGLTPAKELPFSGDNAPTVRILVADLLRREGEPPEPERSGKRTKIGVGAGIAALLGLAAIGYGALQLDGGAGLTTAGESSDHTIGPATTTTALAIQPDLVASSAPTLAKEAGSAAPSSTSPSSPAAENKARPGRTTQQAAPPATTTTVAPAATSTEPATTTTPAPVVAPTTTSSPAKTTPTTDPDTGLLGTVTGVLSGVISGVLG